MSKAKKAASAPKRTGRTGVRRALVEKEIMERAAALFAERGFAGTTLQDLAQALDMSRPALYYYIPSKNALLERLVENLSRRDAKTLEAIRRKRGIDPPEKLREMARELATNAGANPRQARILVENRHHLPAKLAQADRAAERSIVASMVAVLEAGIQRGQFRAVDTRSAVLGIIGLCIWTAWWIDSKAPPLTDLTEQIADQAVRSVLVHNGGKERENPAALLGAMREDLAQLERLIER